jgi:DNA-binding Lrp family transcriptional regulator
MGGNSNHQKTEQIPYLNEILEYYSILTIQFKGFLHHILVMVEGQKVKIDKKDRQLINELLENSRQTIGKLSKKIGLPPTTIHNRIKKLEKGDIILNYSVNLNYKKLGRPIMAYLGVTIDYSAGKEKISQVGVAEAIQAVDGVHEASILTGGMDIIAKVLAKDIDDLNDIVVNKLRNIPGVDKTQTMIVLRVV